MSPLPRLPLGTDVETKPVLRATATAHRYLAELKGAAATIPNQGILIDTLGLQEAKDSSEVEQIITTHDELYQARVAESVSGGPAAKEVQRYAQALRMGFDQVTKTGLIRGGDIKALNAHLEGTETGYRKLPGTELKNAETGEVVYTPPQDPAEIDSLMANLVDYINDASLCEFDPLVKMALIHHQFESIHPFYDGNGRTGRIINILFLVAQGLLDIPVLYLSRFIVQNKSDYYSLLQSTRDGGEWEPWLLYMLRGIGETAQSTLQTVRGIGSLMMETKHRLRNELPKVYSQDLLNNLFRHPYTKIEFLMDEVNCSRPTASKYLQSLVGIGILSEHKVGRSKFFVNDPLYALLVGVTGEES